MKSGNKNTTGRAPSVGSNKPKPITRRRPSLLGFRLWQGLLGRDALLSMPPTYTNRRLSLRSGKRAYLRQSISSGYLIAIIISYPADHRQSSRLFFLCTHAAQAFSWQNLIKFLSWEAFFLALACVIIFPAALGGAADALDAKNVSFRGDLLYRAD